MSFTFWLGTHQPCFIGRTDAPLLLNRNRLAAYRPVRRSLGPWFVDSGGFSVLLRAGRYPITPQQYVEEVRRWSQTAGTPSHISIQDWLCEEPIRAQTGLSVEESQERTVASYLDLRALAPELPWLPILQGYSPTSYFRCLELYERAGHDLRQARLVGLGSVCMRQATTQAEGIIRELHQHGLKLHAFGFKLTGLPATARYLSSSDSNNWSNVARWSDPLPGHTHKHCGHCLEFALKWRQRVLEHVARGLARPHQTLLW